MKKVLIFAAAAKILVMMALVMVPGLAMAEDAEKTTTLYLTETAFKSVEQDRLSVRLRIEKEDKKPQWVQNFINKNMMVGLAEAKELANAEVSTGRYHVYKAQIWPEGHRKGTPKEVWRGSQTLVIDTEDAAAALKKVEILLEAGFVIDGMNYYLSRTKRAEQRDELIAEALEIIRARASKIGKQLGLPMVHLEEVKFGRAGNQPQPTMMRAVALESSMAKDVSTPVASPGKTDVEVVVNVKAQLGE